MSWYLAGNLNSRSGSVKEAYPGTTVYSIGDQSHASKNSDHNPDSRDVVHAIDVMTYSDYAKGNAVVDWCLADTTDLEYVIFDRKIYSRNGGWDADSYSGSDPHTDHVHISGKHGSTGYNDATGTGYDTTAEAYRPDGMDEMAYEESEMQAFPWQYDGRGMRGVPEGQSTLWTFGEIYANTLAMTGQLNQIFNALSDLAERMENNSRRNDDIGNAPDGDDGDNASPAVVGRGRRRSIEDEGGLA
jgi:hypothetical protein